MSELKQELERYLRDGRYGIVKFQHAMPGRARALIARMHGEPIERRERFWVTLRDAEDEQFVWDRFESQ